MKHIKLFEQFVSEGKIKNIKVGSILNFTDGETWKVTKFIGSPSNPRGVFALPYGDTKEKYVSVAIEFKMDDLEKSVESINEAKEIENDYTFSDLQDYYKGVKVLRDAGFYRSGNGNPPKGDEPGTYVEDERWLNLRVVKGEKEAFKLLKKSKLKYKADYSKPMGYMVHNHGGYLD